MPARRLRCIYLATRCITGYLGGLAPKSRCSVISAQQLPVLCRIHERHPWATRKSKSRLSVKTLSLGAPAIRVPRSTRVLVSGQPPGNSARRQLGSEVDQRPKAQPPVPANRCAWWLAGNAKFHVRRNRCGARSGVDQVPARRERSGPGYGVVSRTKSLRASVTNHWLATLATKRTPPRLASERRLAAAAGFCPCRAGPKSTRWSFGLHRAGSAANFTARP